MSSPNSNSSTSMYAASNLSRSDQLEILIARIARVVKQREGLGVEDWLEKYEKKEVSNQDSGVSTSSGESIGINSSSNSNARISHHQDSDSDKTKIEEEEVDTLVDISPLILKALVIRKGLLSGALDQDQAELEVEGLLIGCNESQEKQIRQWSGV